MRFILMALTAFAFATKAAARDVDPEKVLEDPELFCKGWDLRTVEGCREAWEIIGGSITIELFIKTHWEGQNHWLKNLGNEFTNGLPTDLDNCANIDSSCKTPEANCTELFDNPADVIKQGSFWVFRAVEGLHSKLQALKGALVDATIINGLNIPEMLEEFEAAEPDPSEIFKWASFALSMGSTITGAIGGPAKPVEIVLNLASNVMDAFEPDDPESDLANVTSALSSVYKAAAKGLEDMLWAATGHGDEEDYEKLPAPVDDTFETDIARFFNGGFWLLDDDTDIFQNIKNNTEDNIRYKLVDIALKAAEYHLFSDQRVAEEDCNRKGHQWMLFQGEHSCFSLFQSFEGHYRGASEEIYDLMEKWGIPDRLMYYTFLNECAATGGDEIKSGVTGHLGVPTCFVNVPSKKLIDVRQIDPYHPSNWVLRDW